MRWLSHQPTAAFCAALLVLPDFSLASPVVPNAVVDLLPRQTITPGGKPCGQNNATNRGCWKNSWTVNTDYEATNPPAFNTRTFDFHITNETSWIGPDGVAKQAMLINSKPQYPGPRT